MEEFYPKKEKESFNLDLKMRRIFLSYLARASVYEGFSPRAPLFYNL